jgi:CspA family cold shock protein
VIAGTAPIGQLGRRRKGGASLVASGTVKWFNEENGYGYIADDAGGKDLFVHRGSILGDWRSRTLPEGTRVGFELREGGMSPEAVNVLAFATKGKSMTASALATEPSEFRCARCGYGICVRGALPACPMCQTTNWEPSAYPARGRR